MGSRTLVAILLLVAAASAQDFEITGLGGYGTSGGEAARTGVSAFGASFAWSPSKHGLQVDYMFTDFKARIFQRHFLTGSYLLQGKRGRVRPHLHVGAGVMIESLNLRGLMLPPGASPSTTDTSFAATLGFGVTINATERLFIRPLVRGYGYVGPNFAIIPAVAVGYRW